MSPELKESRSTTCLELEIEYCTIQHKTVKYLLNQKLLHYELFH